MIKPQLKPKKTDGDQRNVAAEFPTKRWSGVDSIACSGKLVRGGGADSYTCFTHIVALWLTHRN